MTKKGIRGIGNRKKKGKGGLSGRWGLVKRATLEKWKIPLRKKMEATF